MAGKSLYLINPVADVPSYYGVEVFAARGLPAAIWTADLAIATVAAMARLGNDSLVVLVAACTWPIARTLIFGQGRGYHYAILGVLLGLGLLTKATFLPFAVVVMGVLALRIIRDHGNGDPLWPPALRLLVSVAITAAISCWWYLHKLVETGSAIGSHDVALMHSQGGLIQGLLNNASVFVVAKIPWIIGISFLWGGTC